MLRSSENNVLNVWLKEGEMQLGGLRQAEGWQAECETPLRKEKGPQKALLLQDWPCLKGRRAAVQTLLSHQVLCCHSLDP